MKLTFLIIIGIIIAVIYVVVNEPIRSDYKRTKAKETEMKSRISELRNENDKLKEEIYKLKTDPFYLEKYARNAFGLAASNEIIYRFKD